MAQKKFDGILEAVRLDDKGQLLLARLYERRGPIVSDHLLVQRDNIVQRLKDGQRLFVGKRVYKMGSVFEIGAEVHLSNKNTQPAIVVGANSSDNDQLNGVPVF